MKKKKTKTKRKVKGQDKKGKSSVIQIPANLLAPIGRFLQGKLKKLEKTKKVIEKEDPFKDTSRVYDNASPDTDAAEQFGHARTSAIKEQLERKVVQTKKALKRIKIGKYGHCEDCDNIIDTDRLMVYPEATLCAKCQAKRERASCL